MGRTRHRLVQGLAALTCVLSLTSTAEAHTAWVDGTPVPEWVRNACCGPSDVHHLAPSQVHPAPDGFMLDGIRGVVPWAKVLPSEDGDYWIFYRDFSDGTQYVFCFFAPPHGAAADPDRRPRRASRPLAGLVAAGGPFR